MVTSVTVTGNGQWPLRSLRSLWRAVDSCCHTIGRYNHMGPCQHPVQTRPHFLPDSEPPTHRHGMGDGIGGGGGGCELGRNICKDLIKDRILTLNILYTVYNIYRYTWVRLSVPVGYACRFGMKMCVPMSWVRLSCVRRSGNREVSRI